MRAREDGVESAPARGGQRGAGMPAKRAVMARDAPGTPGIGSGDASRTRAYGLVSPQRARARPDTSAAATRAAFQAKHPRFRGVYTHVSARVY